MSIMSSLKRKTSRGREEISENKTRRDKIARMTNSTNYQKLPKEERRTIFNKIFQRKTG